PVVPGPFRELVVGVVVAVHGQADLLEVVLALGAGGGLADLLDGGQEQADQDPDDREDDQHLDQGKATAVASHGSPPPNKRMPGYRLGAAAHQGPPQTAPEPATGRSGPRSAGRDLHGAATNP